MLNLINNAIKYTPEGSVSVKVSFDRNSQMLSFQVADTGIGIRDEDRDKLFESFQRLEENKNRNIEGTGLGLNITMRLVRMMDGTIDVESRYGEGTTFTALMKQQVSDNTPIGDFAQNIMRIVEHKEEYKPSLIAPDAHILIVDDNDMNLEVIAGLLTDTRMQITTADSGKECIEILGRSTFDIVFLDQMMPGMSGAQTLSKIRSLHLCDDTPIIALTADAIVGARDNYIKEGFTDYLSKPVMYDALEAIIQRYLREELILTSDQIKELELKQSAEQVDSERPLVIAISSSSEKLKSLKAQLKDDVKGVFVKDTDSAMRYLSKK